MNEKIIQGDIESRVREVLFPLFERYDMDSSNLDAILKWKPIVLILGNYSSGKSTFINELLGKEIQRTGQAPTDDSFTVITAPGPEDTVGEVRGTALVNNDRLPFSSLKSYGEQFLAHFRMKFVESPLLENLVIVDSPGMMDSVTEKGRGYDFLGVIGDFTRLADLIVLMFDPHKAGTIKETYSTIRNTLPGTSGEDRIVFVMSRIDDCDNLADLVRSYGTLCWNLSQMTGRKDIPRIYLTYSPSATGNSESLEVWMDERKELSEKILAAPELRVSNILQHVDKRTGELKMVIEAMVRFSQGGRRLLKRMTLITLILSLISIALLDIILNNLTGFPTETLISAIISGSFAIRHTPVPAAGLGLIIIITGFIFSRVIFPIYSKKFQKNVDRLILFDTPYKEHTWARAKNSVLSLVERATWGDIFYSNIKNFETIERFTSEDLQSYFKSIK